MRAGVKESSTCGGTDKTWLHRGLTLLVTFGTFVFGTTSPPGNMSNEFFLERITIGDWRYRVDRRPDSSCLPTETNYCQTGGLKRLPQAISETTEVPD